MKQRRFRLWAVGLATLCLVVGGVIVFRQVQARSDPRSDAQASQETATPLNPARPVVGVTNPVVKDVVVTERYTARVHSQQYFNVAALVPGTIAKALVKEGQTVKQGQLLFQLQPALYQAKYDEALVDVEHAKTELANATDLRKKLDVSPQEVKRATTKLARAEAKARIAKTELQSTEIKAPFDGLIGRLQRQAGSVVKPGDAITTLSNARNVWVYFNMSEARYLTYMTNPEEMKLGTPTELVLGNGRLFPQIGKLAAIGTTFDDHGRIALRADFANPDGLLRHGQGGNVVMHHTLKNALIIPQRAVFSPRDKPCVYVVDKTGVAHRREIAISNETDSIYTVTQGLSVSDVIVVDGVQFRRPTGAFQIDLDGEKVETEYRKPETIFGKPQATPQK